MDAALTQDQVVAWIRATCPGTQTQEASADLFFFPGDDRMFPFATIVTHDDPHDDRSRLDRPGAFRLNIGVSPATFRSLFPDGSDPDADLSVADTLFPHPVYGQMFWLSVVNPGPAMLDRLTPLLREASDLLAARDRRRGAGA